MKNCELCNGLARIYCESDQANLCWECDMKVHSANFLVAKHSRSLLCHVCQAPTAWSATGTKIGRTISLCERCANEEENKNDIEQEIDLEDIQVVPWSSTPPPPPPSSSSSSDEESLNSYGSFSLKRMREDDDDSGTSTSHREVDAPPEARGGDEGAAIAVDSFSTRMRTPSKIQRTEERLTDRVGLKLKRSSVVKV
ncbi:putative zinc finger protein CONSTANS-LIKE 11 [Lycium barbarum]|uniref:putative zinc finger protein CONSTANS-LIKE 11 n=1 Tax=Lycium barbarum TaxID=112863 RepID=UPI00293E8AC8|nr:putative zinc finger protein CONSTANS-LIKE 11 [Lycium barbarum]